jgi:OmpA-OmpF porin, OOP family
MTKVTKTMKLVLAASAAVAMGACSGPKIAKSDISPTANPAEEINRLNADMQENLKLQTDVLAPKETKKASKYLEEAKSDVADKKDQSEIIEDIAYATSYVKKARTLADDRRGQVQGILDARQAALDAGVNNYKAERDRFDDLDDKLIDAADNFTKNLSPDEMAHLQSKYMNLETMTISTRELGAVRAKIAGSVDGGAENRTPNTLKKAQTDLRTAENVIAQNPKTPEAFRPAVAQAHKSAAFLVAVLGEAKKNGKDTSESVAIQLAQKNQKIGALTNVLGETEQEVMSLGSAVAAQNSTLSRQDSVLAMQAAIEKARTQFSKDEAEVSQQGNNLLIRLKKMDFKVGAAEIPQSSLDVLAKVNDVIAGLETSKVVVEGHTDSTGTAATNQKLSQERAETVAKYLEDAGVAKDEITAVGYGYKKPLASNKSKSGRALNRRVDVIVTVAGNKAQAQKVVQ